MHPVRLESWAVVVVLVVLAVLVIVVITMLTDYFVFFCSPSLSPVYVEPVCLRMDSAWTLSVWTLSIFTSTSFLDSVYLDPVCLHQVPMIICKLSMLL